MLRLITSRLVRGFLILLPVILSYLLFGALFDMILTLTTPITDLLPKTIFPDVLYEKGIALAILVGLCLLAGFIAEVALAKRMGAWVERKLLNRFAPYGIVKSLATRLSGKDVPNNLEPALFLREPGNRVPAFIVEKHATGELTLYVPFAAMPGVGNIHIVTPEKVERLDASMMEALGCLFNWGEGAEALLHAKETSG